MSAAWNGYCAEVDLREDMEAWGDWMEFQAMSDEERAANAAAVEAAIAEADRIRLAELAAMGKPPF